MLEPGDVVGPYEIREFIGQGGMGQVYRAFDPRLERTVALKVIPASGGSSEAAPQEAAVASPNASPASPAGGPASPSSGFSARVLREARAVASLSHPNVVAIYDVGDHEGRLYLAMEYVVGASLRSFIGKGEPPLTRRVRWLVDIARALEAAHKVGLVHRDIKPENVMVREDGAIKVLDFGIARRAVSRSPDEPPAVDTLTGNGSIVGTPIYMAPEQIRGHDVDARSDQFAWGVLAYELVVGERPWPDAGDMLRHVASVLTEEPRAIRSRMSGVPAVVEETILRALARDPSARFASMSDAADALEPFAIIASGARGDRVRIAPRARSDEDPAYAPTTRVPTILSVDTNEGSAPVRRPPRKRRLLSLVTPLFLLGALAVAVYATRSRSDPTRRPIFASPSARPLSTVAAAETAYKDAARLWHDGATAKARTSLEQAIELDPTFSAAHLQLALQEASASDMPAAQASFQSAYEHRHMLLPRDERLLEASEPYVRPDPDVEEWETRMTSVVFQYPRDPELHYYLGRAREQHGDFDGAKTAFREAVRLDEGFAPALAAFAEIDELLGNVADGLETTERCIKRSPIASVCVETRYELLAAAGECTRAKDEAVRWGALEPQSPRPFASLARALHADGAPRASVEEVLSRRWALLPAATRQEGELWDRALLAVVAGDFARAEELAREHDTSLPHSASSWDHARPARLRMQLLVEMDRPKEASKVARAFLDRMAAWPSSPFAPDPGLEAYEAIFRAGDMTKAEFDADRAAWIERERRRTAERRVHADPWATWATAWGSFAETPDEASEALERAPDAPPLGATPRGVDLDFALGKVLALAARWDEALVYLQRAVSTCESFDSALTLTRARLYLAEATEATGDATAARAAYEHVVATWPKGSPSRTARRASERLAALGRR